MSDYTITTNFGAKDSLPSGNAGKVIKGSEFTTEFTNIQTAIATKADTAGDTFTGVVNFSADVAVNTNTLFVDVSGGNVGIGTASPAEKLHISRADVGTLARFVTQDGTNNPSLQISTTDTGVKARSAFGTGIVGSFEIETAGGSSYLAFNPDSTEAMRVKANGNVGIGVINPNKKLHVKDGDIRIESTFPRLFLTDSNNNSDFSIINNNGKFSIYDDTNAAYRMAIDSAGKVGIGTINPDNTLDVEATQDTVANILSNGSYAAKFSSSTAGDAGRTQGILLSGVYANNRGVALLAEAQNDANAHDFVIATSDASSTPTERMRIDSSGNVGIGTASPASTVHIQASANALQLNNANEDTYMKVCGDRAQFGYRASDGYAIVQGAGGKGVAFGVNNATFGSGEAMRIDSSGNLLVGTTTQFGTDGISLNQSGWFYVRRTSDKAATFRLDGNDGDIITFDKAGSTVGSIGNTTTSLFIGSGDVGIRFDGANDRIRPVGNASSLEAVRNGAIDLGDSGARFKDLHLSGGVYLGGTGSANKLDDYEEGTWTMRIQESDTGNQSSSTNANCKYTKIGNVVHVQGRMGDINNDAFAGTGNLQLAGLPFTLLGANTTRAHGSCQVNGLSGTGVESGLFVQGQSGTNYCLIKFQQTSGGAGTIQTSQLSNSDTSDIFFSLTYTTT